jgi:sugar lactone lactonase YvrE
MRETARKIAASVGLSGAALDGIAHDELGRIYVTDNARGALIRFSADLSQSTTLVENLPAAANIAFGRGALDCHDLYVASSGALGRYHGDASGRP